MLSISKHANFQFGARNVRQLHCTTETFVLLWIIILQTNLKLNGFGKITLLFFSISSDLSNCLSEGFTLKLTAK
ncbi:hypothetical protein Hanom_Chr08g00689291 [Helianthus anomalus]